MEEQLSPKSFNFNNGQVSDDDEDFLMFSDISASNKISSNSITKIKFGKETTSATNVNEIIKSHKEKCRNLNEELKVVKKLLQESNAENLELKKQLKLKEQQIQKLEKEAEELKDLNRKLEHNVLKKIDAYYDIIQQEGLTFNGIKENVTNVPVGQFNSNKTKIHLGRDVWISSSNYAKASSDITTLPQFVKKLATIVFGKDTLQKGTISIFSNNRNQQSQKSEETLDSVKLLAIRDIYSFKLQKDHSFSRTDADIEAANSFKYISKHISDIRASVPRKKLCTSRKQLLRIGKRLINTNTNLAEEASSEEMEEEVGNDQTEDDDLGVYVVDVDRNISD